MPVHQLPFSILPAEDLGHPDAHFDWCRTRHRLDHRDLEARPKSEVTARTLLQHLEPALAARLEGSRVLPIAFGNRLSARHRIALGTVKGRLPRLRNEGRQWRVIPVRVRLGGPGAVRKGPVPAQWSYSLMSPSAFIAAFTAGRAAVRSWKPRRLGNGERSSFTVPAQWVTVKR